MALPGSLQLTTDLSHVVVPGSVILLLGLSVKTAVLSSLLTAFHGAGMMSIRDFFGGDDGDDDGGEAGDDGGMVFDESVDDMDDGGLGDFDDMGDDWGGDPGGDGSVGELENRVDELENELASVSSTVSTVKSENEEISESVDEIEDNVRKLLDIYEMVTRGVNPFVDDAQQGGAFDDGSFGLFDDEDDSSEAEEDLDDDIVDAEAESFFDDDFDGDADDDLGGGGGGDPFEGGDDDFADGGDDGFEDDGFEDDPFEDGDEDTDDGGGGGTGKSFDELKSEYDSGDAEWAKGDEEPESGAADAGSEPDDDFGTDADFGADSSEGDDAFAAADGSLEPEDDAGETISDDGDDAFGADDFGGDEDFGGDDFGHEEPGDDGTGSVDAETDVSPEPETDAAAGAAMTDGSSGDDEWESPTEEPSADAMAVPSSERPYLTDLQGGYVAEMVVMEWLTYLVEESDALEAHRAVKYYEDVEWISEGVADRLWDFLDGFPRDGPEDALPPREDMSYPSELTVDHHIRSLSFIANLAGDQQRELFDRWNRRGEPNALQH